ncbi:MAG: helix-turn-helix domain-containing protein [Alphaproteobacteria bacterium]
MNSSSQYYSIRQVAARYGVHRNTVGNWLRSGALASVKLGTTVRISEDALTDFEAGTSACAPSFESGSK